MQPCQYEAAYFNGCRFGFALRTTTLEKFPCTPKSSSRSLRFHRVPSRNSKVSRRGHLKHVSMANSKSRLKTSLPLPSVTLLLL